jgi:2-hydroxychromene-2-carboxylate isomerase
VADTIDFYFDVISPYVYIADARLPALRARRPNLDIVYHPVLFAGLLNHWGQLGPAEIGPKREFTFKDVARRCAEHGLPLVGPASHPFNPLTALRAILATDPPLRPRALTAILRAGWADGRELGDPNVIAAALTAAGLPGVALVARATDPDIKAGLIRETEQALARGVFGVPTFLVKGQLLWGQDRLVDIDPILDGRDPADSADARRLLSHPASAVRPGSKR